MTTAHSDDLDPFFQGLDELWPVAKPEWTPPPVVPLEQRDEAYARKAAAWCAKALAGRAETLAAMPPDSGRNDYLNKSAWVLYRYALAGHLDVDQVTDVLRVAAVDSQLGTGETEATLHSAYRGAAREGALEPPLGGEVDPFGEAVAAGDGPFGLQVDPATGEILSTSTTSAPASEAAEGGGPADDSAADAGEPDVGAVIRERLPILDWHALWADSSQEEWIVEPILPARRLVAIYSPPKVGKSLLCLEIGAAIAAGRSVLGVEVPRPYKVLYVDFENDPKADVRERLQAMGYGPDDLAGLHYLSFPNLAALDGPRGGAELMLAVAEYGCEVVVIDTISRAVAGEENENDTWLAFYRHTGLRMKQAGVSLIRLDHSGKDVALGQRGGSAKGGDVDAVWRLSRLTEDSYRLDCEMARMPITEKVLVLHRELGPLRHRVDAEGRAAAQRIKEDAALKVFQSARTPTGLPAREARQVVRGAGLKARNEVIDAAYQRWSRRAVLEGPADYSGG